jgi:RsiW-degrading membrane proteinase PrsW (M82 family)
MEKSSITISVHSPDAREKFFFLLSGILISVPFTFFFEILADSLSAIMSQFNAQLWSIAIVAPLVEEFAKAYPLFYRHGETDKSIFTLGFLVGLGFGIAEYFLYVLVYGANVILRLPGILFHAASTSVIAYGIASKKPFYFYLIVVFLHFANNFSTLFGDLWLLMGVSAITFTYTLSAYLYGKLKNKYY